MSEQNTFFAPNIWPPSVVVSVVGCDRDLPCSGWIIMAKLDWQSVLARRWTMPVTSWLPQSLNVNREIYHDSCKAPSFHSWPFYPFAWSSHDAASTTRRGGNCVVPKLPSRSRSVFLSWWSWLQTSCMRVFWIWSTAMVVKCPRTHRGVLWQKQRNHCAAGDFFWYGISIPQDQTDGERYSILTAILISSSNQASL